VCDIVDKTRVVPVVFFTTKHPREAQKEIERLPQATKLRHGRTLERRCTDHI
jgi:hypothetical protein